MLSLERAARDGKPFGFKECSTCPEEVRCAHFEGRVVHLWLTRPFGAGYSVCGPDDEYVPGMHGDSFVTDDLPAAEAEFHRREQELLHG